MAVVRVRPPGYTDAGDPIEAAPTRVPLCEAFTAPRTSSDITDRGRAGVIVGLTLFGKYGTDLKHTDQVEVDGVLYDVDGEPGQWKNPLTGTKAGFEVALTRAAG